MWTWSNTVHAKLDIAICIRSRAEENERRACVTPVRTASEGHPALQKPCAVPCVWGRNKTSHPAGTSTGLSKNPESYSQSPYPNIMPVRERM
ncbi:hypothetical protein F2P79_001847 [Pimephales promelas]|nr:hypothetical protein F2P79_001847 [Pimephales promelas]